MQTTASDAANGHLTGYGSPSYRHYVLILLMLVYTLNFIDRTLIAVVAQPIIESFQLTDAQWGLLYGPPFAIFYAVMGLPIALWADRSNRVHIISLCIVLWSIMTALCGVAIGFFTLLYSESASPLARPVAHRPPTRSSAITSSLESAPPHWGCTPWA